MTNYEKIYISTDNMADFLAEIMACYGCPMIEYCKEEGGECRENIKEWLEMEVVDNE